MPRLTPLALAIAALMATTPPQLAVGKTLNITYPLAFPNGAATVSVVNDKGQQLIKEFILVRTDHDLLGDVTVDQLRVSTLGTQISQTVLYDTELYLTGQALSLQTQQVVGTAGLSTPLLTTNDAPTRLRVVQDSNLGPGSFSGAVCYNFQADLPCGPVLLVKQATAAVLDTRAHGLTMALWQWSGSPDTAFDQNSVALSFQGRINNYQITPGLMQLDGTGVVLGDTAYNAILYTNAQLMPVSGDLSNQPGATLINQAKLGITATGVYKNYGQTFNNGEMHVLGRLFVYDGNLWNQNHALLRVGAGGYLGQVNNIVMDNQGRIVVDPGGQAGLLSFANHAPGLFDNEGQTILGTPSQSINIDNTGQIINSGTLTVSSPQAVLTNALEGGFTNFGTLAVRSGSTFTLQGLQFTSQGLIQVQAGGALVNGGDLVLDGGSLHVAAPGGSLRNLGFLTQRAGVVKIDVPFTNESFITANDVFDLNAGFVNQGAFEVGQAGFVSVQAGASAAVALRNQKFITLGVGSGTGGSFMSVLGGIDNAGTLSVTRASQLAFSGTFTNHGTVDVASGSSILGLTGSTRAVYLQPAAGGGSTNINGLLDVDEADFYGSSNVLTGVGIIRVKNQAYFGPAFVVQPGNSPGTLTIEGDVVFDGASLEIQFGARAHDRLVVRARADGTGGQASFAGTAVRWSFLDGVVPDLDDTTPWLSAVATDGLSSLTTSVTGLAGRWSAQLADTGDGQTAVRFDNADAYQIAGIGDVPYLNQGLLHIAPGDYAYNTAQIASVGSSELRNEGRFYNRIGADLTIADGAALTNAAGAFLQNRGHLTSLGTVTNRGSFVNHADGGLQQQVNAGPSSVINHTDGDMTNHGQWQIDAGASLVNHGRFVNTGTLANAGLIDNAGGRFEVAAGGQVTGTGLYQQRDAGLTVVDGLLQAGNIVLHDGRLLGSGTLQATGGEVQVADQVLRGAVALGTVTLSPGGAGIGRLTVNGDLLSLTGTTAAMEIDLAGSASFDELVITGDMAIDTMVSYRLLHGFLPQPGDSITWLQAGGAGRRRISAVTLSKVADDGSSVALPTTAVQWLRDGQAYVSYVAEGRAGYAVWTIDAPEMTVTFYDHLAAPVPEPNSALLMLAGLLVLPLTATRWTSLLRICTS